MKHFIKIFGLCVVFGLSVFFFGQSIPDIAVETTKETNIQDCTFPLVQLQLDKFTVNQLHGYSSSLSSSDVRDSITPVGTDKSFQLNIAENESKIKMVQYELLDIANDKVIDEDTITALESVSGEDSITKSVDITLNAAMDTSTEYGLRFALTTNTSKVIYYYTRIKYYDSDFFLKEKLNFVQDFHDATFGNNRKLEISSYLESPSTADSTLAKVTIRSSKKMVQWSNLKPKQITPSIFTIKELNIETAAICSNYFVTAKTSDGRETYLVKEFYRVRYSMGHMYLLAFNRTMDAQYDPSLTSLTMSQLKLGITQNSRTEMASSDNNKKFAFVRNGSLWYFDLKAQNLERVFSFQQDSRDYERAGYDQHDIRILKMDDSGQIRFVVYGYMNCGDYEGRVGILLYSYDPSKHQITERVYIPLETTYQQLKEDFGKYCYINDKNVFYFTLNQKVYAYNLAAKRYTVLSDYATSDNFAMMNEANCFVWSDATSTKMASHITVMNLDNERELQISAPKKETIRVLGALGENIVYGFVKKADCYETTDGTYVQPVYKMVISDTSGNILKEYQLPGIYVTQVTVSNNILQLKRVKRTGNSFRKISSDSVLSQKKVTQSPFQLTRRKTDKALTEYYITLPAGYVMEKNPGVTKTKYVMVTENTTLHLGADASSYQKTMYYVYALGGITDVMEDPGEAIRKADKQMGVVMDNHHHIVWERGGRFLSKTLSSTTTVRTTAGVSSVKACAYMLLQDLTSASLNDIKGSNAMDMLGAYLTEPVNLTGCTVDEILYFVSNEHPVIAMKNASDAVIILAYDTSSVTWYDPSTGTKTKQSLNSAENYFKNAGYVFISYL